MQLVSEMSDAEATAFRRCFGEAGPGDCVSLEFADGTDVNSVVTGTSGHDRLAVDLRSDEWPRSFASPSLKAAELRRCELRKSVLPLFEYHRGTGQQWFTAHANELSGLRGEDLRHRFFIFGVLLALAVANQCKLSFVLPAILFRFLLDGDARPSLDDLRGFDDMLYASLKKCLKLGQAQFKALKEVEGLHADMSREEYLAKHVNAILMPEAFHEIRRGFWRIATEVSFRGVAAGDLRQIVCPTSALSKTMDMRHIFRVVMDDEMAECDPFVEAFWAVLESFSQDEKSQFLLFVTGVEAPPEPGSEQLTIQLPFSAFSREEHLTMLGMLPQAHTCTNTLELPNYHDSLKASGRCCDSDFAEELRRILGERLRLAIAETAGYELDVIDDDRSSCNALDEDVAARGDTFQMFSPPPPRRSQLRDFDRRSSPTTSLPPIWAEVGHANSARRDAGTYLEVGHANSARRDAGTYLELLS